MKKIIKKLRKDDGFTLLEMTIVIMIIAALLLLIIPNVSKVNDTTDKTTSEAVVNTVETQITLYKMENPNKNISEEEMLNVLVNEKWITDEQRKAYNNRKK